jgi:hypothetical protein
MRQRRDQAIDAFPAIQLADVEDVEIAPRVVEIGDDARGAVGIASEPGAVRNHTCRRVLREVLVEQPARPVGGAHQTIDVVVDLGLEALARLDLGAYAGSSSERPRSCWWLALVMNASL